MSRKDTRDDRPAEPATEAPPRAEFLLDRSPDEDMAFCCHEVVGANHCWCRWCCKAKGAAYDGLLAERVRDAVNQAVVAGWNRGRDAARETAERANQLIETFKK